MQNTPKSLRLQIAILGRTNAGKSTLLNFITNQDAAIVSEIAGTTTDLVEKPMELLPFGPILLIDSAGFADESELGSKRMDKTEKLFDRADVVLLTLRDDNWGDSEEFIVAEAKKHNQGIVAIINKSANFEVPEEFLKSVADKVGSNPIVCNLADKNERENFLTQLKDRLFMVLPEEFIKTPELLNDFVKKGDVVVLLIPIDIQAPKGRLIMPQVQTLRACLDIGAIPVMCKESEFVQTLSMLPKNPDLIICDSQMVDFMVKNTPNEVKCTTFSILFSRLKADMKIMAQGALSIAKLQDGDKILIAESCSHHPTHDDIGRVKIPLLLKKKTGKNLKFEFFAGSDFPKNLKEYKLVIQCGSCMLNRRETLSRVHKAVDADVPITNYGMVISTCQGVFDRVMEIFLQ